MVKRRYSNSRKRKSQCGKKSRHTRRTKRHMRRGHRRTRRGGQTPGPPTILTPLGSNQPLTSGMPSIQRGGSETSTGGSMVYNGGRWDVRNPVGGPA
jgi:hypothetical protein